LIDLDVKREEDLIYVNNSEDLLESPNLSEGDVEELDLIIKQ